MDLDYDAICKQAQQNIERDRGRAAELSAAADEKQLLIDALKESRRENQELKKKYEEEHKLRLQVEQVLQAEQQRPMSSFSLQNNTINELITGDKITYAQNNCLEGMSDQRASVG